MTDASSYWSPLCEIVMASRYWVRVAAKRRGSTVEGRWGQLLVIPVSGYLEASDGAVPMRDVEWVDVSTKRIVGGIAGRARQSIDIKQNVLSDLRGTKLKWEVLDSTWSVDGVFDEEFVQVVRVSDLRDPLDSSVGFDA